MRAILLAIAAFAASLAVSAADTKPLRITTYNLRFASDTPPNDWPTRRPVMKASIEKIAPDIFGTQEGVFRQMKDMSGDLPRYHWIGLGREGGSKGEFMAIFYDHQRFEPLEYDHFWLSDTPEVIGSRTWGNTNHRMVTWARFADRANGNQQFYLVNTHFDHQVQLAREKSATLLRQRIDAFKMKDLPVVLTGDFNASAGKNKAYEILTEGDFLKDTWHSAAEIRGPRIPTFHNFKGPRPPGDERIDWILTRGPVQANWIEIDTFNQNGQYPSDHFPVTTELVFARQ
jgi:endonuclease/exonuclease/phosphatase family metal-dependent hydrolase